MNEILATLTPLLGPYGPAIAAGIAILEKVAPAAYQDITLVISNIRSGETVAPEDVAKLNEIITRLKNPDNYFQ